MIHLCPDELALASTMTAPILLWGRRLLSWVRYGRCAHAEMVKEFREDGHLDVVCSRCGYRTHLLERAREDAGAGR